MCREARKIWEELEKRRNTIKILYEKKLNKNQTKPKKKKNHKQTKHMKLGEGVRGGRIERGLNQNILCACLKLSNTK